MYGTLSLSKNTDGTYDLLIHYDRGQDTEFGLDFLSQGKHSDSYQNIQAFLRRQAKGLKVKRAKFLVGGVVLAMLPLTMLFPASAASDRYSMAYLYVGNQNQQLSYVKETREALDTVSPSYFDINPDGSLRFNRPANGMVDSFHDMGIRVVPFLSNHWDRQAGIQALEDPGLLARQVAELVVEHDMDGVNVDIENLTPFQRDVYVEFVALLREELPEDKEVSVAVAANPWGWTTGWHGSYDYEGLAQHADYLMLMTYDEHYQGGEAGPVASIGFVEDSILHALGYMEADQVVVGLPLFGRLWGGDGYFEGHGVPLNQVEELIQLYDANITYDEERESPMATFVVTEEDEKASINGRSLRQGEYELWYENDRSMLAKLDLVDDYSLKGTSSWALGQQSEGVWQAYQSWLEGYDYMPQEPDEELPDEMEEQDTAEGEENQDTGEGEETVVAPPSQGGGSPSGGGGGSSSSSRPSRGGSGGSSRGGGGGGGGGSGSSGISLTAPASSAAAASANTPAAVLQRTGAVRSQTAALRTGAGTEFSSSRTLAAGTGFTVLGKTGDWYRVRLSDGNTGYVAVAEVGLHNAGVVTGAGSKVMGDTTGSGQVIATPEAGTAVTILERSSGGWTKVKTADGKIGYVQSMQVAYTPFNKEIELKSASAALRLRSTPTANAQSLGTLPAGEKVLVLGNEDGYVKISYGTVIAYVTPGYLA